MELHEARERVQKALDDQTDDGLGERWPIITTAWHADNEVDAALQAAVDECVSIYSAEGGDQLDVVFDTTTASDGTLDLSALATPRPPIIIKSVSIKTGSSFTPIKATRARDAEGSSGSAHDLRIRLVMRPDISTTGNTSVVNYAPDSALVWPLMDAWIVAVAAKHLLPKEATGNAALDDRIIMLRDAVIRTPEQPMAVSFPRHRFVQDYQRRLYRWSYVAYDATTSKKNCLRVHRLNYGSL